MQAMLLAPIAVATTLAVVDGKSLFQRITMDNQTLVRFGAFIVVITVFLGAMVVAVTDLIANPNAALPVGIVTVISSALTFAVHTLGVNLGSNLGSTVSVPLNTGQNGSTTATTVTGPTVTTVPVIQSMLQHTGVGDGPVIN